MAAALFFDIDGTLIDSYHGEGTIRPSVMAELRRLQDQGHKIFFSSGRPRPLLTTELLDSGFDGMVLANGGHVEMDGESVYEERMGADLARKVVDFLERRGEEYLIACAHNIFTRPDNAQIRAFFSRGGRADFFTYDFEIDEALPLAIKMETLTPVEDRDYVTAMVAEQLGPEIICDGHGGEGTFELFPKAISKAKGIEVALERLGIDVADSYGFGDGANDLEMLRFCGCGIAMGNAQDVVKEAADIVCPPVWDDGLVTILRQLFP